MRPPIDARLDTELDSGKYQRLEEGYGVALYANSLATSGPIARISVDRRCDLRGGALLDSFDLPGLSAQDCPD